MQSLKYIAYLLLSGFLIATGVYILIAKYFLATIHPLPTPDIFIPVAQGFLHPEIEIPLYAIGMIVIPTASYGIFLLLKSHQHVFVRFTRVINLGIFAFSVLYASLLLINVFFSQYFNSPGFIDAVQKEGYTYFTGFTWWHFSLITIVFSLLVYLNVYPPQRLTLGKYTKAFAVLVDVVVIAAIIALTSFIVPWDATKFRGPNDYGGVVGVLNDILGEKIILVNAYSQYGLVMPYAVSLIFRFIPLTYYTFFNVNYTVTMLGYILLYITVRLWLRSPVLGILFIFLAFSHQYFAQETNILFFGQNTFLRFGWWIILFFYLLTKEKLVKNTSLRNLTERMIVAIGVFWAFDTGTYILFSYVTYVIIQSILTHRDVAHIIRSALNHLIRLALSLLAMFLFINLFSFVRSGQWPNWQEFYFHTTLFATNGFGMTKLPSVGPYLLVFAFHLIVATALIYMVFHWYPRTSTMITSLSLLGFLTAYAMLQLLYYVGESVPGNLHLTILPTLLIICFLLSRLRTYKKTLLSVQLTQDERVAIVSVGTALYVSFLVITTIAVLNMIDTYKHRGPISYYPKEEFLDKEYLASIAWLKTYFGDTPPYKRRMAIISEGDWLFLMRTQSTNIIDSGFNYYFETKAQYQMLCDQLYDRNPKDLFVQHDPGWGWTDYLRECAYKRYKFVENIGYLDRWERN